MNSTSQIPSNCTNKCIMNECFRDEKGAEIFEKIISKNVSNLLKKFIHLRCSINSKYSNLKNQE